MRFLKIISIVCFSLIVMAAVSTAEFISLEEIEPGMSGTARTVFQGVEVEEFPLTIIDIVKGNVNDDLILIKAYGEKIEETGGIASGMSGSPVYIEGRLAGAISYGWHTGQEYALVTPIERMLKLKSGLLTALPEHGEVKPLKSPLIVSGLSGRALEKFKKEIPLHEFEVIPGGIQRELPEVDLKPGSAVAVKMVRGDINVAALGTLTHIENDKILAMGHPFTNRGKVSYLLSMAEIHQIIPGNNGLPFKLGSPFYDIIGTIETDRAAGIAGRLNVFPRIIPLQFKTTDIDRNFEQQVNVQLINDQSFLTSLGSSIALQAIDSSLDRIGEGTANVKIKLMGQGLPSGQVVRENLFQSDYDIAVMALAELTELFNLLVVNPFFRVRIFDIKVELEVTGQNKRAVLQRAKILNEKLMPGDNLKLELELQPYRQEEKIKEVEIKIPESIETGPASLLIEGGFTRGRSFFHEELSLEEQPEGYEVYREGYRNLDEMLASFLARPTNDEIIIELYPAAGRSVRNAGENEQSEDVFMDDIIKLIKSDYVMEGSLYLDFFIGDESDIDLEIETEIFEEIDEQEYEEHYEETENTN